MDTKGVKRKIQLLVDSMGVPKTKLGEVLGSKSDNAQAKIDRTNRFFKKQKYVSLEEIKAVAKFFGKPLSYFLGEEEHRPKKSGGVLQESKSEYYGKATVETFDSMSEKEMDEIINDMQKRHPEIFGDAPLSALSLMAKRIILKAYYLF